MPEFFKGIGAARFGVMAGVAAALTAFFLYVAGVISEPPKTILYSGPRTARRGPGHRQARRHERAVRRQGRRRHDPRSLRSGDEAAHGTGVARILPAAGVGYEIFDKSDTFGTTAFVQNINRLRALEGELARSIQSIDGIDSARVHLVIPERQIFAREDQPPSASVVLKHARHAGSRPGRGDPASRCRRGRRPRCPTRVAIVDDKGDLLAGGDDKTGADADAADQEGSTRRFRRPPAPAHRIHRRRASSAPAMCACRSPPTWTTITSARRAKPSIRTPRSCARRRRSSRTRATPTAAAAATRSRSPTPFPSASSHATPRRRRPSRAATRTEETTNYEISKTIKTSTRGWRHVKTSLRRRRGGRQHDDRCRGQGTYTAAHARRTWRRSTALVKSAIGFDKSAATRCRSSTCRSRASMLARCHAGAAPLLGLDSG